MNRSTGVLVWIAAAGWLLAAVSFILTGTPMLAMGFAAYAASACLMASGGADRTFSFTWLTYGVLAVATVIVASSAFVS